MICPTVSDLHFLLHINPFLASTQWTQPTSSPSFLSFFPSLLENVILLMHSSCVWNVLSEQCFILPLSNIIWISSPPPMLWLHQSDKIHPLPTRADINRTKYITHTHTHMPDDMMRCATDVYTDVTATTNRFQCRRTRSIWNVIINNFDTQIHFTISIFNFSFPRLYNFEIVQF